MALLQLPDSLEADSAGEQRVDKGAIQDADRGGGWHEGASGGEVLRGQRCTDGGRQRGLQSRPRARLSSARWPGGAARPQARPHLRVPLPGERRDERVYTVRKLTNDEYREKATEARSRIANVYAGRMKQPVRGKRKNSAKIQVGFS